MPNFKTHIVFGAIFAFGLLLINQVYFHFIDFPGWQELLMFVPIIAFMSIVPDLDQQASKAREFVTISFILATIFFLLVRTNVKIGIALQVLLGVMWLLPHLGKWGHRGHMHSIVFIGLLSLPLLCFGGWKIALIGFAAGFSHLLADREIKIY